MFSCLLLNGADLIIFRSDGGGGGASTGGMGILRTRIMVVKKCVSLESVMWTNLVGDAR